MNSYYKKLINSYDSIDLKNLLTKWNTLSDNMKHVTFHDAVLLPDILMIAKSGVGITNMLHYLAEYLHKQGNLLDFYGDVKFFEFILSYCPPDQDFTDLKRFMDEVTKAAGFRSEFKGLIHIDIDEWVCHYEEKHFISFMEYLADHSEQWLVILSVTPNHEKEILNLNAFLAMYLRIEKVTLSLPKTEQLFDYIQTMLHKYNLHLNEDTQDILYQTIECLRKNPYFDGYKTINILCQDIVYHIYSNMITDSFVLTKEHLKEFSVDSDYVKRTIFKMEKMNRIGFSNKENTYES